MASSNRIRFQSDLALLDREARQEYHGALENNKTVQLLNLGRCYLDHRISFSICELVKKNKTLRVLDFGGASFNTEAVKAILEAAQHNTHLEVLSFTNSKLTGPSVNAICELLRRNSLLRILDFSMAQINNTDMSKLLRSVGRNTELEVLSIPDCEGVGTNVYGLCKFLDGNCFHNLDLSAKYLKDDGLRKLLHSLKGNKTLQILSLGKTEVMTANIDSLCRLLKCNNTLRILQLNEGTFTPGGSQRLFKGLAENSSLENLVFSKTELNDDILDELCILIQENKSLEFLQFNQAVFSARSLQKLLESLSKNKTLRSLVFEASTLTDAVITGLCRFIDKTSSMINLQFSRSKFTDNGLTKLLRSLQRNRTLKHLFFSESRLTDAVTDSLSQLCTQNFTLETLQFVQSTFTDRDVVRLADCLKNDDTINHIGFADSQLTGEIMDDLCEFIKQNTTLNNLQFGRSRFTNKGLQALLSHLVKYPTLNQLDFWESRLNDSMEKHLGQLLEKNHVLKNIQFDKSTFISDGLVKLFMSLAENKTLEHLVVLGSKFPNAAIYELCKLAERNSTLTSLQFGNSTISHHSLKKLRKSLQQNTILKRLAIWESPVTDNVADALCSLLDKNKFLRSLVILNSRFSEKTLQQLITAIKRNPMLEEIILSESKMDDGIAPELFRVFSERPSLRVIEVEKGENRHFKWAMEILKRETGQTEFRLTQRDQIIWLVIVQEMGDYWTVRYHPQQSCTVDGQQSIGRSEYSYFSDEEDAMINTSELQNPESLKEDATPAELRVLGTQYIEAYQRSCESQTIEVNKARVMIIGYSGAGKSSLLRCLQDQPFEENCMSTIGIDTSSEIVICSEGTWTTKTGPDDLIAERVVQEVLGKNIDAVTLAMESDNPGSETQIPVGRHKQKNSDGMHWTIKEFLGKIRARFEKVREKVVENTKLPMWDFAGQIYYITHQLFMTPLGVYILVLDMTKPLDYEIPSSADSNLPRCVSGYIDYWMSLIYSQDLNRTEKYRTGSSQDNATAQPGVIIVCTHKDLYTGDSNEFVASVRSHVSKQPYYGHIYTDIMTFSNKNPSDTDKGALKYAIEDLAKEQTYSLPPSWLHLIKRIKENHEVRMKWHEVIKVGKDLGMEEKDVKLALQFFHAVGDLVSFEEPSLRDFLINDPQWLIDRFKEVFNTPAVHQRLHGNTYIRNGHHALLHEHGILTDDLLRNIWPVENFQVLVQLMIKMALLLPWPESHPLPALKQSIDNVKAKRLYLVPSMLEMHKLEPLDPHMSPLFLEPVKKFLPIGLTSCLITRLVGDCGWEIKGRMYKNAGTLLPNGAGQGPTIHIQERDTFLELLAESPSLSLRRPLREIVNVLQVLVCTVCPMQPFHICILCPRCTDQKALIPIETDLILKTFCTCDTHGQFPPPVSYAIWFDDSENQELSRTSSDQGDENIDVVAEIFASRITKELRNVQETTDFDPLYDALLNLGFIQKWKLSKCMKRPTNEDRVNYLITHVMAEESPRAFILLARAMVDSGQRSVLETLVEKNDLEKIDFLSDSLISMANYQTTCTKL